MSRRVTPGNPATAGRPNSRATIAPCDNTPPVSITSPGTKESVGYYKVLRYQGAIQGAGISSITLPAVQNNIVYQFYTTHDAGFVDIHKGFLGDADDNGAVVGRCVLAQPMTPVNTLAENHTVRNLDFSMSNNPVLMCDVEVRPWRARAPLSQMR